MLSDRVFRVKSTISRLLVLSVSMALVLSCVLLPGCGKVKSEFPTLPESSTTDETSSSEVELPTINTIELTVATPYSYSTCMYLAKLYVAKERGLLGDGVTGATVDLDYLDSLDIPFVLQVYGTSETGCDVSTMREWKSSGDTPDIFLTDSLDQMVNEGLALPLSEYLASDTLLSPSNIYPEMLEGFYMKSNLYGIPFQAVAHVLYCDMEVLQKAEISAVSFRQNKTTLLEILSALDELNEDERTVIPFYQASDLIPFLPCSFYGSDYLSISDEELAGGKEYKETLSYLSSMVDSGYTYESLDEDELEKLLSGISPLLSRRVGIWYGSSDEISRYDNYMPNTLSIMEIPSLSGEEYAPALLSAYPLCISSNCEHPKEASAFAAFMALDEDAILLAMRLQQREGFLPVVTYPSVWTTSMNSQKYGAYLLQYQENMVDAIYIPSVSGSTGFKADLAYISEHAASLLNLPSHLENNE